MQFYSKAAAVHGNGVCDEGQQNIQVYCLSSGSGLFSSMLRQHQCMEMECSSMQQQYMEMECMMKVSRTFKFIASALEVFYAVLC